MLIVTAPSGAGKTTIVNHLLKKFGSLAFSVSVTTRKKRHYETHGKDYYFITTEEFRQLIREDAFVEWEEVYQGQFYGTLKTEVERLWKNNKNIIFDIDVKGARNIKSLYPDNSLAIFIKPPSLEALVSRLHHRETETEESFQKRIKKASEELSYEQYFDVVLINDDLEKALQEAEKIVGTYLKAS